MKTLSAAWRYWSHFKYPVSVLWQRFVSKPENLLLIDRKTGTSIRAKRHSLNMYLENWVSKDYLLPNLPIRSGDLVVDVGANQGFFTCLAAGLGARVIACEPDPNHLAILQQNVVNNGFQKRVDVLAVAVAAQKGSRQLVQYERLEGGLNTIQDSFVDWAAAHGEKKVGQVAVETIDFATIVDRLGDAPIRLCKLDCEGSELEILQSLSIADRQRVEAFVLEYHPNYPLETLMTLLEGWGTHTIDKVPDLPYASRNILTAMRNDLQ